MAVLTEDAFMLFARIDCMLLIGYQSRTQGLQESSRRVNLPCLNHLPVLPH